MGGKISKKKKKNEAHLEDGADDDPNDLDEEAIDAAKHALAIQREDYTTYIELIIQCQHLPKLDLFSQSDPMVVAYLLEEGIFKEIGKTEVQSDNPNPKFTQVITAPYNFEKKQLLKFEVYDVDELKDKDELDKQELIGFLEITIHEIVCSQDQSVTKKLVHAKDKNKKVGSIMIKGVEKDQSSHKISFQIGLRGLNIKSLYALQVSTPSGPQGSDSIVLRTTEFHMNPGKKGFDWEAFMVMSNKLPDEKSVVRLELIERKDDKNNFIGEAEVNFGNIIDQPNKTVKIMKSGYVLGNFKIVECKKVVKHSFLNYVYAGTEISLIMAIDFTNSNGDANSDTGYHHIEKDGDNYYMQAIRNIGGILQYYDSDNLIPIYGFGAKLPPYFNVVSHCFALNTNYFNPEVEGLSEVINTYKKSVQSVRFHGPTAFSEVINLAVRFAESTPMNNESQKYYILLIITDGDISDFEATKDQLVRASELPISVIIVGIGEEGADFEKMEELDGDEAPVHSKLYNKDWDRDIVHFVKLSDFKKDNVYNIEDLALSTLEEIPKQVSFPKFI